MNTCCCWLTSQNHQVIRWVITISAIRWSKLPPSLWITWALLLILLKKETETEMVVECRNVIIIIVTTWRANSFPLSLKLKQVHYERFLTDVRTVRDVITLNYRTAVFERTAGWLLECIESWFFSCHFDILSQLKTLHMYTSIEFFYKHCKRTSFLLTQKGKRHEGGNVRTFCIRTVPLYKK